MKLCSVEGCAGQSHTRGMCSMHNQRVLRRGTTAEPPKKTLQQRFWEKVEKTPTCWNWTGASDQHGYGQIRFDGFAHRSHRVSYEFSNGPIPEGLYLDHKCHNPACVNPEHLRPVTQKQNMEHRKGPQKNNRTSGVLGVSWNKLRNKWYARLNHNGESVYVGCFSDLAEAEAAVIAKRLELFTHNDVDRREQQAA